MYERFLAEAARIERQHAIELAARRGWLLPAKPSIARQLVARIRSRRRRHNIEVVTQTATTNAQVAAPALDGVVATIAFVDRPVAATGTPVSTTDSDTHHGHRHRFRDGRRSVPGSSQRVRPGRTR